MISQSVMQAAVQGKVTVSDKIRALATTGASRSEIANFLGRSYQHVRQVLVEDERRRGTRMASPDFPASPEQEPAPRQDPVAQKDGPFRLTVDRDGRLVLPPPVVAALGLRPESVAIARTQDGELMLSSAERAMEKARALVRSLIPADVSLADELLTDRRRDQGE